MTTPARRKCGQPMPNAHGEPSGHIKCGRLAGHELPHECRTDYVRHTWEPPAAAAPAVKAKPKPEAKPTKRRRTRRRPRRRRGYPKVATAALAPLGALGVGGASIHVLSLVLPHLAHG